MTTSQNPYGPQAQPAQPYAPMSHNGFAAGPQTGPQRVGRHSAPAAQSQAMWASGPQQPHRAPAGFAPQGRVDGSGYASTPQAAASADHPRNAGHAAHVPSNSGYAPQNSGYAPQNSGHTAQGTGFAAPSTGFAPQAVADRVAQAPGASSVPAQRSGENPLPVYPAGGGRLPAQARPPRNGLGTTALVLGILAALFAMIPIIGMIAWPLSILGLVFGVIGIARTRSGKADNKGVAISGTVLSAIGLILCIVWVAAVGSAVSSAPTTTGTVPASSGAAQSATGQAAGAFPGATSNDVVGNAGDTLTVGDMQISATALKPGDSTLGKTLCTTVTYRNTGSSTENFSGIGDWKLQDPSGAALMTGLVGSTTPLSTGQLVPGGTTSGDVCFDDKSAATGQHVLLFEPMMSFSATRGAWLNQVG